MSVDHRQILRAVAALLGCGLALGAGPAVAIIVVAAVMAIGGQDPGAGGMIAGPLMVTTPVVGLLGMALGAAVGATRPWGRAPQTLLALMLAPLFPIGTAYAGYALWVTWLWNDERREPGGPSVLSVAAWLAWSAVTISVPVVSLALLFRAATAATDLAQVEGDLTSVADRDQRRPGSGCGLTAAAADDGCAPVAPTGARTETVTITTTEPFGPGYTATGTLHVPEGVALPRPGVLLLQDTTDRDRDGDVRTEALDDHDIVLPVTERLAESLVSRGLVVLRVDKRSCPRCQGLSSVDDYRLEDGVADAGAALDWLRARPEVAGGVALVGHGEGGLVALSLADREGVAAVATLATPIATLEDRVLSPIERHLALREAMGDAMGATSDRQDLARFQRCLDDLPTAHHGCKWQGVELAALQGYDALVHAATETSCPVPLFAAYGSLDLDAPASNVQLLRAAQAGADAEFHLIPGMCHRLEDLRAPQRPPTLHEDVLERLGAFLGSVAPLPG